MIDNKNLLQLLRIELQKMNKGDKIKFLTYKKDRSILVEKGGDTFTVVENGYRQIVWENLTEIEVLKRMKKLQKIEFPRRDRKSTRLNSSHVSISYAVFCLKKKKER